MAWGVEDTRYVIWAFLLHTACKVAWLCSALCKLSTVVSVLPCWQLHVAWVPNRPTSADRSSSLLVVVAPWQRRSGATTRYLKVQQHGQYTSSCPVGSPVRDHVQGLHVAMCAFCWLNRVACQVMHDLTRADKGHMSRPHRMTCLSKGHGCRALMQPAHVHTYRCCSWLQHSCGGAPPQPWAASPHNPQDNSAAGRYAGGPCPTHLSLRWAAIRDQVRPVYPPPCMQNTTGPLLPAVYTRKVPLQAPHTTARKVTAIHGYV